MISDYRCNIVKNRECKHKKGSIIRTLDEHFRKTARGLQLGWALEALSQVNAEKSSKGESPFVIIEKTEHGKIDFQYLDFGCMCKIFMPWKN